MDRIGIVGAGTMGSGIAIAVARAGRHVQLLDRDRGQIGRALEEARGTFLRAAQKGRMTEADAAAASSRIAPVQDAADLAGCDLVIEAVFEDADVKAGVLREVSHVLPPAALLATNTSCLGIDDLARHVHLPRRFLGLHFFSPASVNPMVEVVRGAATDEAAANRATAFCGSVGKTPIACADSPGFVVNRFFCPYTNEAARLVDEGVAGPAEIDAAAAEAVGAALGPFAVMNIIKPRINLHAIRHLAALGPFYAPATLMTRVGEADEMFTIGTPRPLGQAARAHVLDRLRMAVMLPVLQLLDDGVATPEAIDRGASGALRFERPPCRLMKELGPEEVRRVVTPALDRYGISLSLDGNLHGAIKV